MDEELALIRVGVRLKHIDRTAWGTKRYLDRARLYEIEVEEYLQLC